MENDRFELPVPHVSDTAWLVAELRAIESERPDAHFHDPLARKLLGDKGPRILDLFGGSITSDFLMSVRTKVIDDLILKTIAEVRPTSARWAWVEYLLAQGGADAGLRAYAAHLAGGSFAAWRRAFDGFTTYHEPPTPAVQPLPGTDHVRLPLIQHADSR